MYRQIVFNKLLLDLSKSFRLRCISKFSNGSTEDGKHTSPKPVDTEEFLHDDEYPITEQKMGELLKGSTLYTDDKNKDWLTTPYPKDLPVKKNEETKPKIDPRETSALIFPGQGTLKVGMVQNYLRFPGAKDLFEVASEILNYDLLKLCLEGPQEKLNKTEFNQPATVVSSLAALEKLREERPAAFESCVATAGYSVGEISALIVSGVISFEDGVRLVSVRGKAMQRASDMVPQGMLSVYCLREAEVNKACAEAQKWTMNLGVENPVCSVAIYLCTNRKIIAGNLEALQYITEHREQYGLSKVSRLPVSGAFHTKLMEPAVKSVMKTLNDVTIETPRCQVYANFTGKPYVKMQLAKKYIAQQIVSPVKWEQCIQNMYKRPTGTAFPRTFDMCSSGRMKTILKLINEKASDSCFII